MKHMKSSYKDVLMTKGQFDKACDSTWPVVSSIYIKWNPYRPETTQHNDNNQLDPEREERIKKEFSHIFRDVLPAKLPPDRGIVHHIQLIEWNEHLQFHLGVIDRLSLTSGKSISLWRVISKCLKI